jgi:hypothetical protein
MTRSFHSLLHPWRVELLTALLVDRLGNFVALVFHERHPRIEAFQKNSVSDFGKISNLGWPVSCANSPFLSRVRVMTALPSP